jgi:serine/threonine protein kinase
MLRTDDFREPEVVVVDFGLSKAMGAAESGVWGGTPGYIPPETLRSGKWFPGGDIFSLGVVMFQMLTNSTPDANLRLPMEEGLFTAGCRTIDEVKANTSSRQPPFQKLPSYLGLEQLCRGLLEKQLSKRLRPLQALETGWMIKGSQDEEAPLMSRHRMATNGHMPALIGPASSSDSEEESDDEADEDEDEDEYEDGGDDEEVAPSGLVSSTMATLGALLARIRCQGGNNGVASAQSSRISL